MAVDAVRRYVGGAVLEPFDRDLAGLEAGILHPGVRLDPLNSSAVIIPELVRSGGGKGIHFTVLRRVHVSALRPSLRHFVAIFLRTNQTTHSISLRLSENDRNAPCFDEQICERVRNLCSRPLSRENIPPRPGTTSMMRPVCFQTSNCEALM